MDSKMAELKAEARGKIVDWAETVVALYRSRAIYGWELEDCADELLAELETVIAEYAPPPARILRALKYGNRACAAAASFDAGTQMLRLSKPGSECEGRDVGA